MLLDHCLSGTSFEIALEHDIQFERKREVEVDKKKSKGTSENIDQIDDEDEESLSNQSTVKKLKQELKKNIMEIPSKMLKIK